jgi:protoporphyrinogen oxidase
MADLKLLNPEIVPEEVDHMEISHWEKALPIYDLQLYLAVKKLHQLSAKEKNFALFGNYVAGISLREMISAAKSFAKKPQY